LKESITSFKHLFYLSTYIIYLPEETTENTRQDTHTLPVEFLSNVTTYYQPKII